MRMLVPAQFALVALACWSTPFAVAQNTASTSPEIEQHIQHVISSLEGEHGTHTLADRMKELKIPGVSIAVIHQGTMEWARGFGVRSVGGPPVDADTMFQAGSISKPVAAMAALRLVQDGKLSLDADINTYLTSWKLPNDPVTAGHPITLRELLTHTAGATVHGFPGYASNEPVPTLVQVLNGEKPANTPPIRSEAEPGTRWKYSGGGYTIMQQVLIDVTEEPFPTLLHDSVLAPIGMSHSTYEQPLPQEFQSFAATPYRSNGEPVEGGAHTYPEMAAAGLWTTSTDLARYIIEVQQSLQGKANHVLSENMTREMLTPGMGHWGLGLEISGSGSNPYFLHGGSDEGFRDFFAAGENNGDGAVVMTSGDAGSLLADEVMRSIATEYGWKDYRSIVPGLPVVRRSGGLLSTVIIIVTAAVLLALLLRWATRRRVRQS
jgi:CubicO group peptidase (beta-lactamase class C family)